jgi:hypothetical protein
VRSALSNRPPAHLQAVAVLGLIGIALLIAAVAWAMNTGDYYTWGALVIGPALLLVTLPLARHVASVEDDPALVKIIMWALTLKLLAAVVRYWVAFEVYGGSADAAIYIREGGLYAERIRVGDFAYDDTVGGSAGTHFIRQLTGFVFALTGTSAIGGFLVFAWFSFWGLYLFYRAFRIGVPDGQHRRYALLVFFLPSLLYWPSSIGKEAWMLLTLGLGAYGAARLLSNRRGGYLLLALGLAGSAIVRPHMTVLLGAGVAASFILRRSRRGSVLAILAKLGGIVAIVVAMNFAVGAAEERFDVEGEGLTGAEDVLERTAEQTSQGGSEFDAQRPDSITDLPLAIFSVLFRPLPHEAHNLQALATSFEGLFLLGLFATSWPRLRRLPREVFTTPYLAFASTYALLFMLAFSSFGNFGILARQRAQLFPLVLVLLALPTMRGTIERRNQSRRSTPVLVVPTLSDVDRGLGGDPSRLDYHPGQEPRSIKNGPEPKFEPPPEPPPDGRMT